MFGVDHPVPRIPGREGSRTISVCAHTSCNATRASPPTPPAAGGTCRRSENCPGRDRRPPAREDARNLWHHRVGSDNGEARGSAGRGNRGESDKRSTSPELGSSVYGEPAGSTGTARRRPARMTSCHETGSRAVRSSNARTTAVSWSISSNALNCVRRRRASFRIHSLSADS